MAWRPSHQHTHFSDDTEYSRGAGWRQRVSWPRIGAGPVFGPRPRGGGSARPNLLCWWICRGGRGGEDRPSAYIHYSPTRRHADPVPVVGQNPCPSGGLGSFHGRLLLTVYALIPIPVAQVARIGPDGDLSPGPRSSSRCSLLRPREPCGARAACPEILGGFLSGTRRTDPGTRHESTRSGVRRGAGSDSGGSVVQRVRGSPHLPSPAVQARHRIRS
jgi:hypothetical protein